MLLLVLLGPAWLKNVLVENLAWCSHHQDDQVGLDYVKVCHFREDAARSTSLTVISAFY